MKALKIISYICFLAVVRNVHCLFYMGLVGHSKFNFREYSSFTLFLIELQDAMESSAFPDKVEIKLM